MKRIGLSILIFFAATLAVTAQNNPSPYSILGIGDIETSYFDRSAGMANTGLSSSSNRFFYHANPASYSNLDNHFFTAEITARYKYSTYSGNSLTSTSNNTASDLQFKKMAIAIRARKHWVVSAGLLPFSTSNYSFTSPKAILGTPYSTSAYYQGSGGLSQVFIGNSFAITKNLSVGIHSAFLFGHMQQIEIVNPGLIDSALTTAKNIYYNNPYFKFGLQYKKKVASNVQLGFGATGSLQTKLRSNTAVLVQEGTASISINDNYSNDYYRLPYMYSAGLSAIINDKYTFAADYNYQGWNYLNYTGVGYRLTNSNRYSVGFEYSKKLRYRDLSFEKYFMQAGLFYNNSYLILSTQQINGYGGTIGGGFNSLKGLSLMGTLEVGQKGTIANGLIKENYVQFTIGISYRDFWYTKIKRYD